MDDLDTLRLTHESIVYLHGWTEDEEGNQEYTDDPHATTGWCVYAIVNETERDPVFEEDFKTWEEALGTAQHLGEKFCCEVRPY